jgi:hypothetical protein
MALTQRTVETQIWFYAVWIRTTGPQPEPAALHSARGRDQHLTQLGEYVFAAPICAVQRGYGRSGQGLGMTTKVPVTCADDGAGVSWVKTAVTLPRAAVLYGGSPL